MGCFPTASDRRIKESMKNWGQVSPPTPEGTKITGITDAMGPTGDRADGPRRSSSRRGGASRLERFVEREFRARSAGSGRLEMWC